jgi:hypothetical protein
MMGRYRFLYLKIERLGACVCVCGGVEEHEEQSERGREEKPGGGEADETAPLWMPEAPSSEPIIVLASRREPLKGRESRRARAHPAQRGQAGRSKAGPVSCHCRLLLLLLLLLLLVVGEADKAPFPPDSLTISHQEYTIVDQSVSQSLLHAVRDHAMPDCPIPLNRRS